MIRCGIFWPRPSSPFLRSIYRIDLYWKKTFSSLYTQRDSFTSRKYKINIIRTLSYRCLRICSSPCLLQSALDDLKRHLSRNGSPRGIISYNMNDVVNKHRKKTIDIITVSEKEFFIVLPYLGNFLTGKFGHTLGAGDFSSTVSSFGYTRTLITRESHPHWCRQNLMTGAGIVISPLLGSQLWLILGVSMWKWVLPSEPEGNTDNTRNLK